MRASSSLAATSAERRTLRRWARVGARPVRLAVRARIVLEAAEGHSNSAIARRLRVAPETVARWRERFRALGIDGLRREAPRAGAPTRVPQDLVEKVLRATLHGRPSDRPAWTTRSLARELRTNHMTVHRIWRAFGLANARSPRPLETQGGVRVDLAGVFRAPQLSVLVFGLDGSSRDGPGPRAAVDPGLSPIGDPSFDPRLAGAELVVALRASAPRGVSFGTGRALPAALLLFLRSVERRTPPRTRLDALLDRPLAALGDRVGAWLEAHPRYRVFSAAGEEEWMRSAQAWFRRWERVPLGPGSFADLRKFLAAVNGNDSPPRLRSDTMVWTRPSTHNLSRRAPNSAK